MHAPEKTKQALDQDYTEALAGLNNILEDDSNHANQLRQTYGNQLERLKQEVGLLKRDHALRHDLETHAQMLELTLVLHATSDLLNHVLSVDDYRALSYTVHGKPNHVAQALGLLRSLLGLLTYVFMLITPHIILPLFLSALSPLTAPILASTLLIMACALTFTLGYFAAHEVIYGLQTIEENSHQDVALALFNIAESTSNQNTQLGFFNSNTDETPQETCAENTDEEVNETPCHAHH